MKKLKKLFLAFLFIFSSSKPECIPEQDRIKLITWLEELENSKLEEKDFEVFFNSAVSLKENLENNFSKKIVERIKHLKDHTKLEVFIITQSVSHLLINYTLIYECKSFLDDLFKDGLSGGGLHWVPSGYLGSNLKFAFYPEVGKKSSEWCNETSLLNHFLEFYFSYEAGLKTGILFYLVFKKIEETSRIDKFLETEKNDPKNAGIIDKLMDFRKKIKNKEEIKLESWKMMGISDDGYLY